MRSNRINGVTNAPFWGRVVHGVPSRWSETMGRVTYKEIGRQLHVVIEVPAYDDVPAMTRTVPHRCVQYIDDLGEQAVLYFLQTEGMYSYNSSSQGIYQPAEVRVTSGNGNAYPYIPVEMLD